MQPDTGYSLLTKGPANAGPATCSNNGEQDVLIKLGSIGSGEGCCGAVGDVVAQFMFASCGDDDYWAAQWFAFQWTVCTVQAVIDFWGEDNNAHWGLVVTVYDEEFEVCYQWEGCKYGGSPIGRYFARCGEGFNQNPLFIDVEAI